MVAAAINLGTAGTVTFTPLDTPFGQLPRSLPLALNICQTNASGACLATPAPSVTATVEQWSDSLFFDLCDGARQVDRHKSRLQQGFLGSHAGYQPGWRSQRRGKIRRRPQFLNGSLGRIIVL